MLYTRHIPEGDVLKVVDLDIVTYNPIFEKNSMELYLMLLTIDGVEPINAIKVDTLYGFGEVPDRYSIKTAIPATTLFVHGSEEEQRFVFSRKDMPGYETVVTKLIPEDSIVFVRFQNIEKDGETYTPDTLAYDNGKLLTFECNRTYKCPIILAFTDNFGLLQTVMLETGAYSVSSKTENSFKSISGELSYPLDKTPITALTVGDSGIDRQYKQFYAGLSNSLIYKVLLFDRNTGEIKSIDTTMSEASITAETFTKTYSFSGVCQFNTKDVPAFDKYVGENNIN